MFLNNWGTYNNVINNYGFSVYSYQTVVAGLDSNGNNVDMTYQSGSNSTIPSITANWRDRYDVSLAVGTGDTEPAANDLHLENDVTSSFSNVSNTYANSADASKVKTLFTFTGINMTGSPITLKEIGIIKRLRCGASSSDVYKTMLINRTLLEEPVTVEHGQTVTLYVEWEAD